MPIIIINNYMMTPEYFSQVKRNYDRLSGFYDLLSGQAESAIFQRAVDLLRSRKIERLLDIGCGTGRGLVELKNNAPDSASYVGVDLSFKMCRKALQKNLEVMNSNVLVLPFISSSFDAVIFSFSIEIIPEELIRLVFDEGSRVLKPGGVVCVICMADAPTRNFISRLYSWAHKKFPKVVDCRPISILQFLNENQFMIKHKEIRALYGMPVEIVMAEKK